MFLPSDANGRTRLLPASIPFRYFVTGGVFQLLGWLIVVAWPQRVLAHAGGAGPGLAALHAFTLGTLAMTAIGASLQLLPVATVQPVRRVALAAGLWWLFAPGVLLMVSGLALDGARLAAAGAAMAGVAMAVYAALLGANLARAKRQRALTLFGWGALAGLVATLLVGPLLALRLSFGAPVLGAGAVAVHLVAACYGFLGLMSVGFSYLLVPMFMVARAPAETAQRAVLAAGGASVLGVLVALLVGAGAGWVAVAAMPGAAAVCVHAIQMHRVVARRRSREPGGSITLMRAAWLALPASVVAGVATLGSTDSPTAAQVFVVLLVPGWLVSLMLGIVLRIVPFLASVHARIRHGKLPLVSTLTPRLPARIVVASHLLAVIALAAGVVLRAEAVVEWAGLLGTAGACSTLVFMAGVASRASRRPEVSPGAVADFEGGHDGLRQADQPHAAR